MVKVRALVVRWHSDDFPGWIEVSILDARRCDHRVVEKVAVLTSHALTPDSPYPIELWIDAEADDSSGDEVNVTLSHGVETVGGQGSLVLSSADVLRP